MPRCRDERRVLGRYGAQTGGPFGLPESVWSTTRVHRIMGDWHGADCQPSKPQWTLN